MNTRFNICDKAVYLNTATGVFETVEIKGIQVVPAGISKNENGENVLDRAVVLYQTFDGPLLSESELFSSKEEALSEWKARLEVL